jgi:hypothetical protein
MYPKGLDGHLSGEISFVEKGGHLDRRLIDGQIGAEGLIDASHCDVFGLSPHPVH